MPLNSDIKFQKALALSASASNKFEAEAAELAARRLMVTHKIDPTDIPDGSLYSRINFTDNALLKRLRDEYRERHPAIPTIEKIKQSKSLKTFPTIPFNINGFSKYAHKRKKNRNPAVQLNFDDHEKIRTLLNAGLELKEIAESTSIMAATINSTRAYHIRSGKWIRDENNFFQWRDKKNIP